MKNISIYQFLLPLSVIMLVIGGIIFFLGYLPGSNLGDTALMVCVGFLFFGFIFFILSLIDQSLSRKRAIGTEQGTFSVQKVHSIFKYTGIIIITIIVVFFAILFYIFSNMQF